jgi:hypothetical protein
MKKETFHLVGIQEFINQSAVREVCFSSIHASIYKEEVQLYDITVR